jgi:hypothetical protein
MRGGERGRDGGGETGRVEGGGGGLHLNAAVACCDAGVGYDIGGMSCEDREGWRGDGGGGVDEEGV